MNLWRFLFGMPGSDDAMLSQSDAGINPANGLPLIEGTDIDVEGNPCGLDSSYDIPSCIDWPLDT